MKSEDAFYIGFFFDRFLIKINESPDKIQGTGVTIGQNLFWEKHISLLSITFQFYSTIDIKSRNNSLQNPKAMLSGRQPASIISQSWLCLIK